MKDKKILLYAGTTEGRKLASYLGRRGVRLHVCVATAYGESLLPEEKNITVTHDRMDSGQMGEFMRVFEPDYVIDATHPYAKEVTKNLKSACEVMQVPYLRLVRGSEETKESICVENMDEAIKYLEKTEGNILVTTGSKELESYTRLTDYESRVYARVLSIGQVAVNCEELGFSGRHLICMQGPFTEDLNVAMLRQAQASWMVTKESGKAGGFLEKLRAAKKAGAKLVVIKRPGERSEEIAEDQKEENLYAICDEGQIRSLLGKRLGICPKRQLYLVGIGMGNEKNRTVEAEQICQSADLLIGARRMVDSVKRPGQDVFVEYRSQEIRDYIDAHPEYDNIVIVLSGDVGFYSGARKLLEVLCQDSADLRVQRKNGSEKSEEERDSSAQNNTEIEIQCGISSVVYFMSQIGLSWDDAKIVSAHGRGCNLISHICYTEKVFSILGTSDGVAVLAEKLVKYGMGDVLLYVGENLSYENEKIFAKPASELTEYKGDPLSVICAVNENAGTRLETHGIRDEEFIRGKAPMTKEEVRTVSLSKLRLTADSVCYDVGAGTGSLSIEMALRAHQGQVWAIEKKEDAVELIHRNKVKFAADNLEIVEGLAPEALKDLPAPTHAFIGGSSGNLKEIVKLLLEKNSHVRIVINCITLETVSEALETAKEFGFEENEIVQLSAARSKAIGRYHMMMGENPIYIITLQNPGK